MAVKREKQEINLQLTVEETNTIIEGLGHLPFMRVYRIIEKIHVQAHGQGPGLKLPVKASAKKK